MEEWLHKFAAVMRLGRSHRQYMSHVRFFTTSYWKCWQKTLSTCQGPSGASSLPRDAWQTKRFGLMTLWHNPESADLCCEMETGDTLSSVSVMMMADALQAIYQVMRGKGGFPVHAALIERDRRGVLLLGASGSGKSTCCQRLPESWNVLGDDLAFVAPGLASAYVGHPLPTWSQLLFQHSAKTWDVQYHVPIAAVMVLEQAEENELLDLGQSRAAVRISHSTSHVSLLGLAERPDQAASIRKSLFNLAADMGRLVPSFILRCSLHGKFWRKIEEALGLPPGDQHKPVESSSRWPRN